MKSTGIERENGFLFSLGTVSSQEVFPKNNYFLKLQHNPSNLTATSDTMQSYLATLRPRFENQKEVDHFWIKVHQAGEIPWMSKISSTWEKVEAHAEDMSTVFIALQGEKVDGKVKYQTH